jgi:DNA-binding transcriptional ArsR family regulator
MAPAPEQLDLVFAALADPTRRAILARLASGEATVNELVAPFELRQPTISKHLKVLERAGLVSRGQKAQFRPVRLEAAPLENAARWIGGYRHFWEASLENLDAYVRELHQREGQSVTKESQSHGKADHARKRRRRHP